MKTVSVIGLGNRGSEYMGFIRAFHSKKVKLYASSTMKKVVIPK